MSLHKNLTFVRRILHTSIFYRTPLSTTSTTNTKNNGRQMSTALDLSGIYPPIPTPFEKNENIDWQSLKSNLRKWDSFPFKGRDTFFINVLLGFFKLCFAVLQFRLISPDSTDQTSKNYDFIKHFFMKLRTIL